MDVGEGHYSRHACHEYGLPLLPVQNPKKCLETTEKEKKRKYPGACRKHCRNFTPFVTLVEGLIWFEAEATLKCISSRLTMKWKD